MIEENNMNEKKKTKKSIYSDLEVKEILNQAEKQMSDQTTTFFEIDKENILPKLPDIQDPDKAHQLYYGLYQKLLKKYLPKGDDFKKARKLIRDEGNVFLKEGKSIGRDGRQAYTHIMQEAVNTIISWYNETKGQDLFGLYNKFKEINKKKFNKN